MEGEILPYSGKTQNFYVIRPPTFYHFLDRGGKYSSSFKYVACDGALLETINILNYDFVFNQLIIDLFSSLRNQTNYLVISKNIRKYQSMLSNTLIGERIKANSSLINPRIQWNKIKSLFLKAETSYHNATKNATKSIMTSRPWLIMNQIKNMTQGFDILHRNHSLSKFYTSLNQLFQWSNRNQSEPKNATNYIKKILSSFERLTFPFTNAGIGRNDSFVKTTFEALDMANSTKSNLDDQMSHNKSLSIHGILGWMKKNAKKQSDRFMRYYEKLSNMSLTIM